MRIVLAALCLAVSAWALAATPAVARDRHEPRLVDRFADDFHGAILQPHRRAMPYTAPRHMGFPRHRYAPAWASPHRGRGHHAERPHQRRHGHQQARRPINPNVVLNRLHRRHWYHYGPLRFHRGHYYLHARDRHHRPFRLVIDAFTARIVRAVPY
jgi:hypothetical protein